MHCSHRLRDSQSTILRLSASATRNLLLIIGIADNPCNPSPGITGNLPVRIEQRTAYSTINLCFVCDCSFATLQSKSVMGISGYINDCLFTATSTTIKGYPTSSCEAEGNGIFETCKVAMYAKNWASEFTRVKTPMFVFNDNKAAVLILGRPTNSGRSKHYDVKFRYVNELIEKGLIGLYHLPREQNGADLLTHSLPRAAFLKTIISFLGPIDGNRLISYIGDFRSGGDSEFMPVAYTQEEMVSLVTLLDGM
jgi:hypothetical protein